MKGTRSGGPQELIAILDPGTRKPPHPGGRKQYVV